MPIQIKCNYSNLVPIGDLKPHPKNPNHHPGDQIVRLAKLLEYQGFRAPVVVSNRSGFIVAGHGRVLAAKSAGMEVVPVSYQHFDSDEQEYAYIVSDNAIAEWAQLDLSTIHSVLGDFDPSFNLEMLGMSNFTLDLPEPSTEPVTRCPACGK